jgi:hypothetical protein
MVIVRRRNENVARNFTPYSGLCIPPVIRFVAARLGGAACATPPFFEFAPILDQNRLGKVVCRRLVCGVLYV